MDCIRYSPTKPTALKPSRPAIRTAGPTPAADAESIPSDSVVLSNAPANPKSPEDEFRETFFTEYAARYCGRNIENFVSRLDPEVAENAKAIVLRNEGFWQVRALQCRDWKSSGELVVRDKNYGFHCILEHQGKIYDFDYGIEPSVVPVKDYFETMFLSSSDQYVKPNDKVADYEVEVVPAQQFGKSERTSTKMSLGQYLTSWGVNIRTYENPHWDRT